MKTVAYFSTLMRLAHELGQARLSGDPDRLAAAERAHDEYRDVCLAADELRLTGPPADDEETWEEAVFRANREVQDWVSRYGEALPNDFLHLLSNLDHYIGERDGR